MKSVSKSMLMRDESSKSKLTNKSSLSALSPVNIKNSAAITKAKQNYSINSAKNSTELNNAKKKALLRCVRSTSSLHFTNSIFSNAEINQILNRCLSIVDFENLSSLLKISNSYNPQISETNSDDISPESLNPFLNSTANHVVCSSTNKQNKLQSVNTQFIGESNSHTNSKIEEIKMKSHGKNKKLELLLSKLQSDDVYLRLVPDDMDKIFEMFKINMFRKLYIPSIFDLYSNSLPYFPECQITEIQLVHSIFQHICKNVFSELLMINLNETFVSNLISMLKSTNVQEQVCVVDSIKAIYQYHTIFRKFIIKKLVNLIVDYLDENVCFLVITPILNIIIWVIAEMHVPIDDYFVCMFKYCVYPLFSTTYSTEFWSALIQLTTLFYGRKNELADWAIVYLLKHWPITALNKSIFFFKELINVFKYIDSSNIEYYHQKVCNLIRDSIDSTHSRTVLEAIKSCLNNSLLVAMTKNNHCYINMIIPLLFEKQFHSDKEIQIEAVNAIKYLEEIFPENIRVYKESGNIIACESDDSQSSNDNYEFWEVIKSSVPSNFFESDCYFPQERQISN